MNTPTSYDKILLIEDNPGDARLVREAFAEGGAGVQLKHCASLQDAIRHLERDTVDVILLDLGLPDATGLDGLSAIDRVSPRTPIVIFTGNDDEANALRALRRGAQDHLVKGECDRDTLLRSVRYARERQNTLNLRSDLLVGIARELKEPVDTLEASLPPLLEANASTLSERQVGMLQRVRNTVDTLRRFHEGILDFACEEDGRMRYETADLGGTRIVAEIKRRMTRELADLEEGEAHRPTSTAPHSLRGEPDAHKETPTRFLLIEDDPGDARLIAEILVDAGFGVELTHSSSLIDAVHRLTTETYDVALIDLGLPDAAALEAVTAVRRLAPRMPMVVITGRDDDATAAEALRCGAQDYLIKGRIDGAVVGRSIRFARERQRTVNLRSELLESIAFELRAPIHVVLGYVHLLLETIPDPLREHQVRKLYDVLETTRTLRWLADAMLDVAGAERGLLRYELGRAGVPAVIESLKYNVAARSAAAPEVRRNERLGRTMAVSAPPKPGRLFRSALRRREPQRKQVLIVDPDYDSRTIIRAALEGGRYEVIEAETESDILKYLISESVHLAILEPRAPEIAAPGALDEVRKVATSFKVPMVLFGHGDTNGDGHLESRREYRISKPFTPEQFLFAVDHALESA